MSLIEECRRALEAELGEPITIDGLTRLPGRTYDILQRKKGHRHSTDDLLTAWYALDRIEHTGIMVDRCLDLGTGIGSVGLTVLAGLEEKATLTCIEAQDVSFRFLEANVRVNGLEARVQTLQGDLRDLALGERFPLVTGSPPYFDVATGIVPVDSQKAHARFELRGDVRDYTRIAAQHLAPGGLFVFCFPWAQRTRALAAAAAGGFHAIEERAVVPREGLTPLFSVFSCRSAAGALVIGEPFVVRDAAGAHTPAMKAVRARLGWV